MWIITQSQLITGVTLFTFASLSSSNLSSLAFWLPFDSIYLSSTSDSYTFLVSRYSLNRYIGSNCFKTFRLTLSLKFSLFTHRASSFFPQSCHPNTLHFHHIDLVLLFRPKFTLQTYTLVCDIFSFRRKPIFFTLKSHLLNIAATSFSQHTAMWTPFTEADWFLFLRSEPWMERTFRPTYQSYEGLFILNEKKNFFYYHGFRKGNIFS